ncbi:MAG: hypothetical protein Q8K23_14430 [Sulfuritalea sp.]|nr:hypothetical protein [Sulfuritalea sp.]
MELHHRQELFRLNLDGPLGLRQLVCQVAICIAMANRILCRTRESDADQVENPELRIREIINALDVVEHQPRIGRPVGTAP